MHTDLINFLLTDLRPRPGMFLTAYNFSYLNIFLTGVEITCWQLEQFFVAVQWLIIEENKESGKDEKGGISYTYRPSLRTKYIKEGKGNTWLQFPNEVWIQSDYDGFITASLQY